MYGGMADDFDDAGGEPGDDVPAIPGDPDSDAEYGEDESNGPGPYGMHNAPYEECPECGYLGSDEECPECGASMGGGGMDDNDLVSNRDLYPTPEDVDQDDEDMNDWYKQSLDAEADDEFDDTDDGSGKFGGFESGGFDDITSPNSSLPYPRKPKLFNPDVQESLMHFMVSARNIIDRNRNAGRGAIGEALNQSWQHHVQGFDARYAPTKVQVSLQALAKRFPEFRPLTESGAMDKLGGTAIGKTGGGPKDPKFLAPNDQPGMGDMKELGEPLGKKQKNNLDGTPTIKGTAKGMSENVQRLTKYVQKHLQEGAAKLRGKFQVSFACLVQEGKAINRTTYRARLAEAVADVEELLQFHKSDNVVLEATFHNGKKAVLLHRIPMLQVAKRNPLVAEGRTLFRFARHAEQYAEHLMSEGLTCKMLPHNWGSAVQVVTEKKRNSGK
jgi:flagellar hook protein FlgE